MSNRVYAQAAAGGADDAERAVEAAAAFESGPWPGMAANAIADGIGARSEQIAAMETFDTGLPVTQARGQAGGGQHSTGFYLSSRIVHVALGDTQVPRFGA